MKFDGLKRSSLFRLSLPVKPSDRRECKQIDYFHAHGIWLDLAYNGGAFSKVNNIYLCFPRRGLKGRGVGVGKEKIYELSTKCAVKMAGYWPRSFLCVFMDRDGEGSWGGGGILDHGLWRFYDKSVWSFYDNCLLILNSQVAQKSEITWHTSKVNS